MNTALILIGGKGNRFDKKTPKQFFLYKGTPLFIYTVNRFQCHKDIDNIAIVSHKDYVNKVKKMCLDFNLDKVHHVVSGGDTREESVNNGLKAVDINDIVLIHDGCRPFVSDDIISTNIKAMDKYDAVVTAVKVNDTISISRSDKVEVLLDRNICFLHQTPQTFKAQLIKDVLDKCQNKNDFTDEATLLASLGYEVQIIEGNKNNIKITTQEDLIHLNQLL